ncbi:hypothetical protein GCM10011402_29090 [Paracoccus acridae]|uniref:Uncharacterized protein n=1 Tax=Paracoccus acridae TaxID=1795310 RepID=A0ABQ1VK51_9RHOB|nr:hypothetical protein [Paracoccus acridae]GGF74607.1 hypothetical protein GCM10011402_29090 [Paracoccus acridae]
MLRQLHLPLQMSESLKGSSVPVPRPTTLLSKDRPMVNFLATAAVMFLAAIIMFGLAVAAMP